MRLKLLFLTLLACVAGPVAASPILSHQTCIDAPTQTCVMELAIYTAERVDDPAMMIQQLLDISAFQEHIGASGSAETFGMMMSRMGQLRYDDPLLTIGNGLFDRQMPQPPIISARLADYHQSLLRLDNPFQANLIRPQIVRNLIYSGQAEAALNIVRTFQSHGQTSGDHTAALALLTLHDLDRVQQVIAMMPHDEESENRQLAVMARAIDQGSYVLAGDIASSMQSRETSARAYGYIAWQLTRQDRADAAQDILQFIFDNNLQYESTVGARYVARTIARSGDLDRLRQYTGPGNPSMVFRDLRALAYTANGDLHTAFHHLRNAPRSAYLPLFRDMLETYRANGGTDFALFIEQLPPDDPAAGLRFIIRAEIELGNAVDAERLLANLSELDTPRNGAHDPDWSDYEVLLHHQGYSADAVASAYERQDALALAKLASFLN
jgi:hypothetical protein